MTTAGHLFEAEASRRWVIKPTSIGRGTVEYSGLHDKQLIERLSYRDITAFETLYDRYGGLVYSTALRVLRDVHIAEDVSQEVFTRLWRQPDKYAAEKGGFVTWLLSVTRNRAVDWLRRPRRRFRYETVSPEQQQLDIPAGEAHDPALAAELGEQRRVMREALASLPTKHRDVIELAYFGGYTQREIAKMLSEPLGTVKTRIRLGMQRLRTILA